MKEEKFKVIQYIRELILRIDKELDNVPKKEIEIKNRIRNNTYDMLEIAYEANATEDVKAKKTLLLKVISKIKVIDFLLNLSYEKQIITEKKYYKLSEKINDIIKYTIGWVKSLN